jgi:hypothetical protein
MELKDSGTIAYSAEPQVLTISILKNEVIDILKSLANMRLIKLETDTQEFKPVFGCAKGQFLMADDFDAPLDCFKEYM